MKPQKNKGKAVLPRSEIPAKESFKGLLERTYSLRLHMTLLTSLSGIFAFLVNYFLLNAMLVRNLSLRYSLVILLSYAFFLFLIKLWLHYIFPKMSFFSEKASDVADFLDRGMMSIPLGSAPSEDFAGGGGGFSGAGASGSWSGEGSSSVSNVNFPTETSSKGGGLLKEGASALDLDDGVVVLVPIVVILAIIAVSVSVLAVMFSIVYMAPAILADIAFEVAVSLGLYRGLKQALKEEQGGSSSWIPVAIKKTALFVLVLLVFNLVFCQLILHYYPEVSTITEIFAGRSLVFPGNN